MKFKIVHITEYSYSDDVVFCNNIAVLRPRESQGQQLLDYTINIAPNPSDFSERADFFGNTITRFSIQNPHEKLKVTATSTILRNYLPVREQFFTELCRAITVQQALQILKTSKLVSYEIKQYILESILICNVQEEIKKYAEVSFKLGRSVFEATKELMHRIFTDFDFVPGFTNVSTPISEVMKEKKGVCQDFAQIAIACIRSVGLPAKYISGYIETLPPPGKKKLIGADASHAWFAVYIPSFGWVDFDPTNNQIPSNQHLVVGWGRDYYDVPPLKGVVYSSGKSKLKVSVDIRAIGE